MDEESSLKILCDALAKERGADPAEIAPGLDLRTLARSLVNVRPPAPLPPRLLKIQDDYLRQRAREKGIVNAMELPCIKESLGSRLSQAERICLWQGDITVLETDAIVNAANDQMLGCFVPMHRCIDNQIHTFAGVQLRLECWEQMQRLRAEHGEDYAQPVAVPLVTKGYNLPARHVIHVAGPIAAAGVTPLLERQLRECYLNVLEACRKHAFKSVVFCCISTGVFAFPNALAASVAVNAVTGWLEEHPGSLDRVVFNVFKDEDLRLYEKLLA